MKGIGRLVSFGIAKESTRGTAPGSATFWAKLSEPVGIQEKDEKTKIELAGGVIEDASGAEITKQWAEGDVKAPVAEKSFGLMLLNALGAVVTTPNSPETGVYSHAFSVAQSAQHPSLSLFIDDPIAGVDYVHANGMISSLEILAEIGKIAEYTANIKAKKGAVGTFTPAFTAENIFRPQDVAVKFAANLAGLNAASATQIQKISLKIEKNLEDHDAIGSITPVDFNNKQIAVSGTIEAVFSSEAEFKTAALNGSSQALRVELKNQNVTVGATTNPTIQLDMAKVIFDEIAVNRSINDIVTQTVSFKAYFSQSDAQMITAKLINTQASY